MKTCTKCNEMKNLIEFSKDSKAKNGRRGQCKKCCRNYSKNFYSLEKNKIQLRKTCRKYQKQEKWKQYIKNYNKTYRITEKYKDKLKSEETLKVKRRWKNNRYKNNINYKLKVLLRDRVRQVLKGKTKSGSSVTDLGCTIPELKTYIESKFQKGMTWENHTHLGWHIDHIIPLSSFDLTNREQFLKACHYTNLQPLWAEENIKKSNKIL